MTAMDGLTVQEIATRESSGGPDAAAHFDAALELEETIAKALRRLGMSIDKPRRNPNEAGLTDEIPPTFRP